jgi:hypothetical protein
MPSLTDRIAKAWNAFRNKDPTETGSVFYYGSSSSSRPDSRRLNYNSQRSIIAPLLNRIAVDAASIEIKHVQLDDKKRYKDDIDSSLNDVLTVEANLDQTARAFRQDMYASLLEEGYIALCPIAAELNEDRTVKDVYFIRTGRIVSWHPKHVVVEVYNEETGQKEQICQSKSICAIVQNPFYDIMNAPNSLMQRLRKKLAMLDALDEKTASGKLDLIIQLPYSTRAETQRERAAQRKNEIEVQLANSKYGVAYIDAAEHVIQLNRSLDNNLIPQIEKLTKELMDQLGISPEILNNSADEQTQQNYISGIIEPVVSAPVDEMYRKWIPRDRRKAGESIMFFKDPFRLIPVSKIADMADKFTRNEIMSSNEFRVKCGLKPSDQAGADDLRNKNINQSADQLEAMHGKTASSETSESDATNSE